LNLNCTRFLQQNMMKLISALCALTLILSFVSGDNFETTDILADVSDDSHDHDHDFMTSEDDHDSHDDESDHDHDHSDDDDEDDHDHDDHDHDDHDDHDHDEHEHDHDEANAGLAMAITIASGFAAFLGASSICCVKREHLGMIPAALGFSSGVVVYLSFMNLIPECIEMLYHSGGEESESLAHFYSLLCVIGGIIIAFISEKCFDHHHDDGYHESPRDKQHVAEASGHDAKANGDTGVDEEVEMTEKDRVPTKGQVDVEAEETMYDEMAKPDNLSPLSYKIAFALILHHLPEGIATFISLYYDFEFGLLVAFALLIHDIPSGVCIAVPTYCITGSILRPCLLCLAAAAAYPIGGLIGWAIVVSASEAFIDSFIGALCKFFILYV